MQDIDTGMQNVDMGMQDVDYDLTDLGQASAIALPSHACLNCTESSVICTGPTVGGCM